MNSNDRSAEEELAITLPEIEHSLNCIKRSDITELKALNNPP